MRDPYDVLGVSRAASQDEIKAAFRQAAKRHHPDGNRSDPQALARFQEVNAAYELLKDPGQRRRFDLGEIRPDGSPRPRPQPHASRPPPPPPPRPDGAFDNLWDRLDRENMFSDLFRGRSARTAEAPPPEPGEDVSVSVSLSFEEAALGGPKRVILDGGETLDLVLPPGLADGRRFRLKKQGKKGLHGGPRGDCYVDVRVRPHKYFRREGRDILLEVPVSVPEAALGAEITVPTLHGPVRLAVPADMGAGVTLRLKGKGVPAHAAKNLPAGDQLVTLRIVLPERLDEEMRETMRDWAERAPYDPRRGRF